MVELLDIEVVYATPEAQACVELSLPGGSTVEDALAAASRVSQTFAGLNLAAHGVGVFGEHVTRDRTLASGDRVEIYRPLQADPKAARRARAEKQRGKAVD